MGKNNSRSTYLGGGSEEGYIWQLYLQLSAKQHDWEGCFYLQEEKKKNKHRTIYLSGGTEGAYKWKLNFNAVLNQENWGGSFQFNGETQRYRDYRRTSDNQWAERTFPRRWRQQYEIHHTWQNGEYCFFLTQEQHRERHRSEPSAEGLGV